MDKVSSFYLYGFCFIVQGSVKRGVHWAEKSNFCSSVLIHLKHLPGITHRKTFEWMQYFGRSLRVGLRAI